ncbi:RDD family protein [Halobacillus salinarum]|uniref:RDD family protein n=1 Tax=Halobacillus salinarum TaxID=2932257 RepID=A0ABY4ELJ6_9BACI|nr:RDD family protein [Halobacillus salinarum]UOQ45034.1 RDD family protein [Halobacillus salinarum]
MNQPQLNIKTPEHVALQFNLAGLGSRAAAQIIDSVLLTVMYIGLFLAAVFINSHSTWFLLSEVSAYVTAVIIVVTFLIFWGYFFLFELLTGGKTPGKMLVGIRVIQENGSSATAISLLIRNLLRIVDMLPTNYLLGMAFVFFHTHHKRIGDIVGGTLVVYERKKKNEGRRKKTPLEKEISRRGITEDSLVLEEQVRRRITNKEWKLLQTYMQRFPRLRGTERENISFEVGSILLPLVEIDYEGKTTEEREDLLIALYLNVKEDWEFEL